MANRFSQVSKSGKVLWQDNTPAWVGWLGYVGQPHLEPKGEDEPGINLLQCSSDLLVHVRANGTQKDLKNLETIKTFSGTETVHGVTFNSKDIFILVHDSEDVFTRFRQLDWDGNVKFSTTIERKLQGLAYDGKYFYVIEDNFALGSPNKILQLNVNSKQVATVHEAEIQAGQEKDLCWDGNYFWTVEEDILEEFVVVRQYHRATGSYRLVYSFTFSTGALESENLFPGITTSGKDLFISWST